MAAVRIVSAIGLAIGCLLTAAGTEVRTGRFAEGVEWRVHLPVRRVRSQRETAELGALGVP